MAKGHKDTPEQIVSLLWQIEVSVAKYRTPYNFRLLSQVPK
jgi:hypothetical protein